MASAVLARESVSDCGVNARNLNIGRGGAGDMIH